MIKNLYYLFSVNDQIFTDLSQSLKDKELVENFYGFAYGRSTYLDNPIYNHITYFSDIVNNCQDYKVDYEFLNKIETEYNIIISDMVHMDRHIMRLPKGIRLIIVERMLKELIADLERFNVDFVLAEGLDDLLSYFMLAYSEVKGIKFMYPSFAKIGNYAFASNSLDRGPIGLNNSFFKNKELYKNNKDALQSTETYIKEIVSLKRQPLHTYYKRALFNIFTLDDIKVFVNYLKRYLKDKNAMHYNKLPILLPYYRIRRLFRKLMYRNFLKKNKSSLLEIKDKKFFVYPIHFHPEAATLLHGKWLNNQITIVEMISKNLPSDVLLVLKEHSHSIGRNPISFYQDISNFHNVTFVEDKCNVYDLLQNSKGVITISSTMGMEALFLNKPVITFGEIFYNYSSNVYKISNFKNIDEVILAAMRHKFDEFDLTCLIFSILEKSVLVNNLIHHGDYTQNEIEVLINFMLDYQKIIKN